MRPQESFIEQPIRSLQTMLRVLSRQDGTIPELIPDGIYGPSTLFAVSAFQRKAGLPVTGITDMETWNNIVWQYLGASVRLRKPEPIQILLNPEQISFESGNTPYIYLLQAMLQGLSEAYVSIPSPGISGKMDSSTVNSLLAFQKLGNIPETGNADKFTWKNLVLQYTLMAHNFCKQNSPEKVQ